MGSFAPSIPPAGRSWDRELAGLPSDWSDAWVELRFTSSDDVEPAALLCAPLNPMRTEDDLGLRFRAARRAGSGAAAGLVRRCHVSTQGPVWYVDGKVV